jgi:hypothetical protein
MNLRKELELNVRSVNKHLAETVSQMDNVVLLRNCHPLYRPGIAFKMLQEKMITQEQSHEFINTEYYGTR